MKLAWYLNRLASMSAPEIGHRVLEQAKRRQARRRPVSWADFAGPGTVLPLPGLMPVSLTPARRDAVRTAADGVLAGDFVALGVRWPRQRAENLFSPDQWWVDPVTGRRWPGIDGYCFDVPYRHATGIGDIKYVWEYNRLQILQPLAAAFLVFGDRAALAAIEAALQSWKEANPPFRGLAWNSGIEIALRAISLAIVATYCDAGLSASSREALATMLRAHRYWLARYPSRFSSANNHLVAELAGLVMIDLSLDPRASSVAKHLRALAREAGRQILPDGAPAEQSPTYGAFTAELILLAMRVAQADGHVTGAVIGERLGRFASFVAALAEPDSRVPRLGDDDEGRVVTLCREETTYPASVARAIAGALGQPCGLGASGADTLREALVPSAAAAPSPPAEALITFPYGGLTSVRWGAAGHRLHLVVDHGPLGYLSIAAHGHADANAVTLALDGHPVLVDPGTYLYHAGREWRDWFRGTRAHNTLSVADDDQSAITGPFNWGRRATAALDSAHPGTSWQVVTRHDGYRRRFGADHRRTLRAITDGFAILDEMPVEAEVGVELAFQLAGDLDARLAGTVCVVSRAGQDLLRIEFDPTGRVTLAEGEDFYVGGWVSERFGEKTPACRIAWTRMAPGPPIKTTVMVCP